MRGRDEWDAFPRLPPARRGAAAMWAGPAGLLAHVLISVCPLAILAGGAWFRLPVQPRAHRLLDGRDHRDGGTRRGFAASRKLLGQMESCTVRLVPRREI